MKINKTIGLVGLTALVAAPAQAGFLLAGVNEFDVKSEVGPGDPANVQTAQDGILSATSLLSYANASTATGGSTDGWYGPESTANGGIKTGQTALTAGQLGMVGYDAETTGDANGRTLPGYAVGAPNPASMFPSAGSNFNGRVANFNGSDLFVTNPATSTESYELGSILFDAFLGDNGNAAGQGLLGDLTVSLSVVSGPPSFPGVGPLDAPVTSGYSGFNTQGPTDAGNGNGDALTPDGTGAFRVSNVLDFGVGTDYQDFVVDLRGMGLFLNPGQTLQVGFSVTVAPGTPGPIFVRGDNFALTAVPEPSSALALAGLLGLGMFSRRRR